MSEIDPPNVRYEAERLSSEQGVITAGKRDVRVEAKILLAHLVKFIPAIRRHFRRR